LKDDEKIIKKDRHPSFVANPIASISRIWRGFLAPRGATSHRKSWSSSNKP